MKRAGSPRINKSVSFALDDNDRPLPEKEVREKSRSTSPNQRRVCTEHDRRPSIDAQMLNPFSSRLGKHFKDFVLYPSPSPSPKITPLPHICDISDEEARMIARQRELESEIAELTRRTLAREEMNRETMRQRAVDVEALLRERKERTISFDNTAFQLTPRQNLMRRFSRDGSVDLSPPQSVCNQESESLEVVENTKTVEREVVAFPTPLPSPPISTTYTKTTVTKTTTRHDSPARSRSQSPVAQRHAPPPNNFNAFHLFSLKDLEQSHSQSRSRSREVSPSDSVLAVVGELEEEDEAEISISITEDEHMCDTNPSERETMDDLPPQCERCGLFGHLIATCRTPALTTPLRRKRGRESEREKEPEERPRKGIRHIRWLPFRNSN